MVAPLNPAGHTFLLVDLGLRVQIEAQDSHVGHDIHPTDQSQDVGVIERDLLRQLHHHQDDTQAGSRERQYTGHQTMQVGENNLHLRRHHLVNR